MILSSKEKIETCFDTCFIGELLNMEHNENTNVINLDFDYGGEFSIITRLLFSVVITSSNVFAFAYSPEKEDTYEVYFSEKEKLDLVTHFFIKFCNKTLLKIRQQDDID